MDSICQDKKINKILVQEGYKISLKEDTEIEFFNPGKELDLNYEDYINGASLAFKLIYKNNTFLFCGDIDFDTEKILLKKNINLKSDVLKVAHHGSKTSTSEDFIKAVTPKVSIISTGKNRYGHPSPQTIKRLTDFGTKIFRTDYDGAITIESNGEKIKLGKIIR
jgi:competence protein ComEC